MIFTLSLMQTLLLLRIFSRQIIRVNAPRCTCNSTVIFFLRVLKIKWSFIRLISVINYVLWGFRRTWGWNCNKTWTDWDTDACFMSFATWVGTMIIIDRQKWLNGHTNPKHLMLVICKFWNADLDEGMRVRTFLDNAPSLGKDLRDTYCRLRFLAWRFWLAANGI